MSEEDRRLFERAVEELDGASRSKVGRLKAEGRGSKGRRTGRSGQRPSSRLDRLRQAPEASIDLHGLRRREAELELRRFLADRPRGEVLLIVHGKGSGALRSRVHELVAQHPLVAESRRAPPRWGGAGALLVRLKR